MLDILFVTDYVCPYCLVAREALCQALAETGIEAEIRVQPMELTVYPKEQVDTYSDPVRRSHYTILVEPAKELGLDMKLPPHIIPRPYTHYAFEGRFYAVEQGKEDAYNELMYKAYFIEEKDIGDMEVLCELVKRLDLDPAEFRKAVESRRYAAQQTACNEYSRNVLKVEGIPTLYINGKKTMLDTYTKEEMIGILKAAVNAAKSSAAGNEAVNEIEDTLLLIDDTDLTELSEVEETKGGFTGCGEDGCGVAFTGCGDEGCGSVFTGCGDDGCGSDNF